MLKGNNNEERIWNYLLANGLSPAGTAGLMGNLYAESGFTPESLQNSHEKKLGFTDQLYTEAVDSGTYQLFSMDGAGYGLAQWTYWTRKKALLKFARDTKRSIGDLEMQLEFLLAELSGNYSYQSVLRTLQTADDVKTASDVVLTKYERPADQSDAAKQRRAAFGQQIFSRNAKFPASGWRKLVVDTAKSYFGCNEADGTHSQIIDIYNSHKPLARGYAVKYTDAWCATFVSAVAIKCGLTAIIPTECGCNQQIALFRSLGAWNEDDSYVPLPGDVIYYDWQDSGSGDNVGSADHVGIVESCDGKTITVIEGNMHDAVGRRTIKVNGTYIRGFGVPKYEGAVSGNGTSPNVDVGTTDDGKAQDYAHKVGDVVKFTGVTHYTSSNATSGKICKPGMAKVTQIAKGAKHPYHLIAITGGGSNVYGWVDASKVLEVYESTTDPASSETGCAGDVTRKIGDLVDFTGKTHYTNSNAISGKSCRPGKAVITNIAPKGKHQYHLIYKAGGGSNVYGWVDAADIN